jgi:hypothetical protein
MATSEKVSATVPAAIVRIARLYAGDNFSAYVAQALRAENLRRAARAYRQWRAGMPADDQAALTGFHTAANAGRSGWAQAGQPGTAA